MTVNGLSSRRSLITSVAVVLALALAALPSCQGVQPPRRPSVHDKLVEAGLADRAKHPRLRIGVYVNQPLMGYVDGGVNRGFDPDLARYVASSLGFVGNDNIEWVAINNTRDRIQYLQNGRADLIFASFSITKERQEQVLFSGPYLITDQRVMIRNLLRGKLSTIEDMQSGTYKVCTSAGSTSERLLLQRNIRATPLDTVRACVEGMREGRFDAVSTDRTILAGFTSLYPGQFTILDLNLALSDAATEQLGVGVAKSNPALRDLVSFFLKKSYLAQEAGDTTAWQIAYNNNLGPWYGYPPARQPPLDAPDLLDFDETAPTP
jgi:glutamate transport system substrate-binding protein